MENDIYEVTIDIQPEHILPAIETGEITTELSIEEEISILQDLDKTELSRMIPGIHKQGLDYDQLKDSITTRAQQKIEIPPMDEDLLAEMGDFFKTLDSQITAVMGIEIKEEGKPVTAAEALLVMQETAKKLEEEKLKEESDESK